MNLYEIQKEINKIEQTPIKNKTEKQLESYDKLSKMYKIRYKDGQPLQLRNYNSLTKKGNKLTIGDAKKIRELYNPYVYGKKRLSIEFKVSTSVILRILRNEIWKINS